jgi:hypothetical protein
LIQPCSTLLATTEGFCSIRTAEDNKVIAVHESPLSKRGWVLQERMLSPRVLSFGEEQIYWECRELCNGSETYLHGFDTHGTLPPFDIAVRASKDGCGLLWCNIIRDYSRRTLSKPLEGKFVALSAIARRVTELKGDSYIAGLFWNDFPGELLWKVTHRNRYLRKPTRATGPYRAPIWS